MTQHVTASREDFKAFADLSGGVFVTEEEVARKRKIWIANAAVFSFAWFFWRRMPLIGAAIVTPVLVGVTIGVPGIGVTVSLTFHFMAATVAPWLYRGVAARRARRADRIGLAGVEKSAYLAAAGGVSRLGGVLGGSIWIVMTYAVVHGFLNAHWSSG